jgi:hypothetical protein
MYAQIIGGNLTDQLPLRASWVTVSSCADPTFRKPGYAARIFLAFKLTINLSNVYARSSIPRSTGGRYVPLEKCEQRWWDGHDIDYPDVFLPAGWHLKYGENPISALEPDVGDIIGLIALEPNPYNDDCLRNSGTIISRHINM